MFFPATFDFPQAPPAFRHCQGPERFRVRGHRVPSLLNYSLSRVPCPTTPDFPPGRFSIPIRQWYPTLFGSLFPPSFPEGMGFIPIGFVACSFLSHSSLTFSVLKILFFCLSFFYALFPLRPARTSHKPRQCSRSFPLTNTFIVLRKKVTPPGNLFPFFSSLSSSHCVDCGDCRLISFSPQLLDLDQSRRLLKALHSFPLARGRIPPPSLFFV